MPKREKGVPIIYHETFFFFPLEQFILFKMIHLYKRDKVIVDSCRDTIEELMS